MFPERKTKKPHRGWGRWAITAICCLMLVAVLALPVAAVKPAPVTLDPTTIPKWENQITGAPPVFDPVSGNRYEITAKRITQQILPPSMGKITPVFAYGGKVKGFANPLWNSPAPSFEVTKGSTIEVKWINEITVPHLFPVDPTLHWASPDPNCMLMDALPPFPTYPFGFNGLQTYYPDCNAQSPVPIVTHVHGLEVHSSSDGNPDAWWTAAGPNYQQGPKFNSLSGNTQGSAIFEYPNDQPPTTLWYHDHALGVTRLNPTAGLAGFYLLRDDTHDPLVQGNYLPTGKYEVPLAIQDRTFYADGSLFFPTVGINPTIHPYWVPEFFGNTIMVNGLVWPYMNVDRGVYRFRLLDGSNARFYTLSFSNKMPFTMIGTEGGYLKAPVILTELTIAPGERADILVDFSKIPAGSKIILQNTAKAPFPHGAPADPQTTGQIMQFRVGTTVQSPAVTPIPANMNLNPTLAGTFPSLTNPTVTRILTLQEVMGPAGPVMVTLDGQRWSATVNETPKLGATEDWVIVNPTADTHPIHLHLAAFQLISRQPFQVNKYQAQWTALNGMVLPLTNPTVIVDPTPYLQKAPVAAPPSEQGWKDTIQMNTGEVTTIRVRFSPIDGTASYSFDATSGPGYVWHCHIIDHEDNEMMRPYIVLP